METRPQPDLSLAFEQGNIDQILEAFAIDRDELENRINEEWQINNHMHKKHHHNGLVKLAKKLLNHFEDISIKIDLAHDKILVTYKKNIFHQNVSSKVVHLEKLLTVDNIQDVFINDELVEKYTQRFTEGLNHYLFECKKTWEREELQKKINIYREIFLNQKIVYYFLFI